MDASIAPPQKRQRKTTFSPGEINALSEEVESNLELLNSKLSNVITNKKKMDVWRQITAKVNAVGNAERTVEEVRNKWRNMCREAKSKFVEHRRLKSATGGGPQPPPLSQTDINVMDLYYDSTSFNGVSGGLEVGLLPIEVPTSVEETWDKAINRALTSAADNGTEKSAPVKDDNNDTDSEAIVSADPIFASTVTTCPSVHLDKQSTSNVQNESLPKLTRPKKKKKISVQDITDLQYKVLQKESVKLDLQIQLLKKLNSTKETHELTASELFASFS